MAHWFKKLFAEIGDKTSIPDLTDPLGYVSYETGYGVDYGRSFSTDPLAKAIERQKMNQVLNDVTGAIQQYQTHGFPDYIDATANGGIAYAYALNAIVRFTDGINYQNSVAGNTNAPNVSGWAPYGTQLIDTISDLRLTPYSGQSIVSVIGYYTVVDNIGVREYYWDAVSVEADNGGTIIQVTGVVTGRWKMKHDDVIYADWFGAKGDWNGTSGTDNLLTIQAALDYTTDGANHYHIKLNDGKYLVSGTLLLQRGGGIIGKGTTNTEIVSNTNLPIVAFRSATLNTISFCKIADLTILGNPLNALQDGIECAGGSSYNRFENILIKDVGGIGLNFNNKDIAGGITLGAFGMLFSQFDNITIEGARTYAIYIKGNSAQNIFTKVRIVKLYGEAGIVFDGADRGTNPFAVTFNGGGVESAGVMPTNINYKCVWFKAATWAGQSIDFNNFYIEPGIDVGTGGVGDVTGYHIESCQSLTISGFISFCHWGIRAKTVNVVGLVINPVRWYQSSSWAGGTLANLTGKAKIELTDANTRVFVNSGQSTSGSVAWTDYIESSNGAILGFRYMPTDANPANAGVCNLTLKGHNPGLIATAALAQPEGAFLYFNTLKTDLITGANRLQIGGGSDIAAVYIRNSYLKFESIALSGAGNSSIFVDTADTLLKHKNATGVVGIIANKVSAPATSTSTGSVGQYATDASYLYICTATNTWMRSILSTF